MEFERMVGDALDEIPDTLAAEMQNVAVMVEDWPSPAQLARVSGPSSTAWGPASVFVAREPPRDRIPD